MLGLGDVAGFAPFARAVDKTTWTIAGSWFCQEAARKESMKEKEVEVGRLKHDPGLL